MKKNILTTAILTILFLSSCKETPKQENTTDAIESVEEFSDEIVTNLLTDKDGKKLDVSFNNTKGTATLNFNGETIELTQQRAASGIWYKNDNYELTGKGESLELTKDGEIVFEK